MKLTKSMAGFVTKYQMCNKKACRFRIRKREQKTKDNESLSVV